MRVEISSAQGKCCALRLRANNLNIRQHFLAILLVKSELLPKVVLVTIALFFSQYHDVSG